MRFTTIKRYECLGKSWHHFVTLENTGPHGGWVVLSFRETNELFIEYDDEEATLLKHPSACYNQDVNVICTHSINKTGAEVLQAVREFREDKGNYSVTSCNCVTFADYFIAKCT